MAPFASTALEHDAVLVGPGTADDAGVYAFGDTALVATADFITPVCDDPYRFGRVAAANSLSDVYAMGASPLFALNLCCFPDVEVPEGTFEAILEGSADVLAEAGCVLLGGHSVLDPELKFGLAVVGQVDPGRMLTNAGAEPGQHLILTKPLGTGVVLNGFKGDELDAAGLEPVLVSMEQLNDRAARLALEHGATACTDVTGFGLAGHAMEMARASEVGLRVRFADLPAHDAFYEMCRRGVTTGSTKANREALPELDVVADLDGHQEELLVDPQTSGGLLVAVPAGRSDALLDRLREAYPHSACIGEVVTGPERLEIV